MTPRAWITTMAGRLREALCPDLATLRRQNAALRADYREMVANRNMWMQRATAAETESERLRARDAEWTEKAQAWLASPEAAQRLAGYRELASKCADLQAEVWRLRSVALDRISHLYAGYCPDDMDITQRDPHCPACEVLGPPPEPREAG